MTEERRTKITLQFRERAGMAYDLDCAGTPLTLRVFESEQARAGAGWRIEARTTDAIDAVVASATAATRAEALRDVAVWWRSESASRGLPSVDWEAVAQAMSAVRAL